MGKKKLIEVAMPLEVINKASIREKSIRHGHPSSLHVYWARRPLAACRAVIFAQLVDDPSSHPDKFPTLELQTKERERLFSIIEELVIWENSNNEGVLNKAHAEILKSFDGKLPSIYDPFSGGASIPLEAQRLGLPAYGSDLNPVAVMIGKSLVQIPPLFKDMKPIHSGGHEKLNYKNAEGLAEDIKYFGQWMRHKAFERIGHLYPEIDLPKEQGGGKAKVIAWIWARTVPSPDPFYQDVRVPLISSYILSTKLGKTAYIQPLVDKKEKTINFKVIVNGNKESLNNAKNGNKYGRGANFKCLFTESAITPDYVRKIANNEGLGSTLIAIVAEGIKGRNYISPDKNHIKIALSAEYGWRPEDDMSQESKNLVSGRGYGYTKWHQLFTKRQLLTQTTFSDLIEEVKLEVEKDLQSKSPNYSKEIKYQDAVILYLSFMLSQLANHNSTMCSWHSRNSQLRNVFSRQAIAMTWDYAETNVFSNSSGSFNNLFTRMVKGIEGLGFTNLPGKIFQADAKSVEFSNKHIISTDPPYYDNIAYSDLSDYFYVWLKKPLKKIFPQEFSFISCPKSDELVATDFRHGGRKGAEKFFLEGMTNAIKNMVSNSSNDAPATIYYAFKQSEIEKEGISSSGWATFLEAVLLAGYSIVGTWPMRTEMANRMIASGTNALANSIVLVCRKREESLGTTTRFEFVRQLKIELPKALADLKAANISPADIPQSSIGPGIGIFSRYKAVLENDDSHMSVKTALQLINRELGDEEGEYDSETSFAITWFEQNGFNVGDFGSANNIANAKGISVNTLVHSGVAQSSGGKFSLLNRESLEDGWNPITDKNLTIWECCQYLIKTMENEGEYEAAKLMKQMGFGRADAAKELAYSLYEIAANKLKDANEATAYNGLIAVWSELTAQAANITDENLRGDAQMKMI